MTTRRYLTDYRDDRSRNVLHITPGGNGDWYVAIAPEGQGTMGRAVRICTSGGASTASPGLPAAIAAAYHAMPEGDNKGNTLAADHPDLKEH